MCSLICLDDVHNRPFLLFNITLTVARNIPVVPHREHLCFMWWISINFVHMSNLVRIVLASNALKWTKWKTSVILMQF